ncbi:MAG: hypothetical protein ABI091_15295 [Ferruginibacter sp.]
MQLLNIRHDLITQLKELDTKKRFASVADFQGANWKDLKTEAQKNLNNLRTTSKIYDVLAYILLTVLGVISFLKVTGLSNSPDLNKGALLIFLTVTNTTVAFAQKRRLDRLEKQILVIDILEKIDSKDNIS